MHRCMNEMNGETQESNDSKRQLRLQKRRQQAEQDLAVMYGGRGWPRKVATEKS